MVVKCGECCLACIEKICDYINESAFAYQCVSGKGFCISAWEAFLLQVKHLARFAFANFLAKVFIFLGKVGLVVGNCFSLFAIMKNVTEDTAEVSSLMGPMAVVAVFTYLTASVVLGLFDTAVLAMMTSLSIDMDCNDGEPKRGPPTFHDGIKKVEPAKTAEEGA